MTRNSAGKNPFRKLSPRSSFAVVGVLSAGVVGIGVVLTPGISIGAFSDPVGQLSTPVVQNSTTQGSVVSTTPPIILTPTPTTIAAPSATTSAPATSAPTSAPTSTAPVATTVAPAASSTTVASGSNSSGSTSSTTKAPATASSTTTATTRPSSVRVTRGTARPGRSITVQLAGFRPRETVKLTIAGREVVARADANGRVSVSFVIPRDSSVVVITATSPSVTRTFAVPVRR